MSAGLSKISAVKWFSELLVSAQMLSSIVYWCVILGSGLDHVLDLAPTRPPKASLSPTVAPTLSINGDAPRTDDGPGMRRNLSGHDLVAATRARRVSRSQASPREPAASDAPIGLESTLDS